MMSCLQVHQTEQLPLNKGINYIARASMLFNITSHHSSGSIQVDKLELEYLQCSNEETKGVFFLSIRKLKHHTHLTKTIKK